MSMCYSAQIWADYRKYERFGGKLSIEDFAQLVGWTKARGSWTKVVPKAPRQSIINHATGELDEATILEAIVAEGEAVEALVSEIGEQQVRLDKAEAKLASAKPTKAAENDRRVANNKIATAHRKIKDIQSPASTDGLGRIWRGQFAPVLIRDPETSEQMIVPMRYRYRLPGWDEVKELEKPDTYNARRDKLATVWRRCLVSTTGSSL